MIRKALLGLTAATAIAAPAVAQDINAAVKARQGQMQIIAYNLGLLGGMAKGNIEYDADLASGAAANVAAAASLNVGAMWPEGSDNGNQATTRAQPAIWSDMAGFQSKMDALQTAAAGADVSGGAASVGAALGAIGGTCKGCHETYRGPER